MTTMTIGAIQFLPEMLIFILPRRRVHPNATRPPINTSKMSPVNDAS